MLNTRLKSLSGLKIKNGTKNLKESNQQVTGKLNEGRFTMTNYEEMQNRTVDEMADLLARRELSCMPFCKQCDTCNERTFSYPFCVEGIKKWLESKVETK